MDAISALWFLGPIWKPGPSGQPGLARLKSVACRLCSRMSSVCIEVMPTCSFARESPATNSVDDVDGPTMLSITCVPSSLGSNAPLGAGVDFNCPPDNVRSQAARTALEPYTIDP